MILKFPTSNGVFNGVIKYLITHGKRSFIGIKSSGKYGSTYKNVDNLIARNPGIFYTERNSNYGQWVMMWLKYNYYVDIEGYSIQGSYHTEWPNHWNFSVSSDGRSWSIIHWSHTATIESGNVYDVKAKKIKFIKWIITGPNNYGNNFVNIKGLDVFGRFFYCSITSHQYIPISTKVLLIILLIFS